ncbi:MAG TPA: protein kinase [Xanthomonadaceae bacterium]|nr:protein kinase [Xanthomonadaceae bacterium]
MSNSPSLPELPGYEILREIGTGGMSHVYLARQTSLQRLVAIKVMRRSLDDTDLLEKRFLLEGRTMAQLPHRNIAGIFDIVQRPDIAYIAMEFLEGGTLSERMRIGLSLSEAVSITVQLAQALQFAHEHGVIHRDLKPANVMFRDVQTPVLTDFGIARQQDASAARLTQTGMLVGTPTYMSPEQINGAEVDGRSDLYSLGILFFELLTGAPPFKGDTPISVLMAHMTQPPPPLPDTFSAFQPILDRCLAKDRDQRYASVNEFVRALKAVVINSQTLMARLSADPNMSSSEQLRALGFSISHPSVSTGQTARTPEVRSERTPRERSALARWPVLVAAGVMALVLIAAGAWWALREPQLDPAVQAVVDQALRRADDYIARGQLVEPAEDNAFAVLETARQAAPRYAPIDQRVVRIADLLFEQAGKAVRDGDLDRAETLVAQGVAVSPGHAAVESVRQQLVEAREVAARQQRFAELLRQAEDAGRRGRDLTGDADDAVSLLRQAQALLPDDVRLGEALDAVAARLVVPTQQALDRNDLDAAQAGLERIAEAVGDSSVYARMKERFEVKRDQERRARRIVDLLEDARRYAVADALFEPPGANALDSLTELLEIDPGHAEAARELQALGTRLGQAADASLKAGRSERAHAEISQALRARPGDSTLLALSRRVDQALGAQRARILKTLEDARQAIADGRIVSPEFESARFLLRSVVVQDPEHKEAQELLEALPRRLAEQGARALAEGRLDQARALADDARRAYPELAPQMPFMAELADALRQRAAFDALAERVALVNELLDRRPLAAATLDQAAREMRTIAEMPQGEQAYALLKRRLIETLREPLTGAQDVTALDRAADALRAVRRVLDNEPLLDDLGSRYEVRRRELIASEASRRSAALGELLLNARPWARLESLEDDTGRSVPLPQERVTPLALELPAGVYRATFRHPEVGQPVTVIARVEAGTRQQADAVFPTLSAADYLRRSGWN